MIIVRLMGGLGNQMFQYAAARRLAHVHDAELKLDLSWFGTQTKRFYELGCFNVAARLASDRERRRFVPEGKRMWRKVVDRLHSGSARYVREEHFHFDEKVLALPDGCYLKGYWQSPRYFEDAEDVIRQDFSFRLLPQGKNQEWAVRIGQVNAVSLHVRRGDYVTEPETNRLHGICDVGYYHRAVEEIAARVQAPQFFIFSDDPQWARESIQLNHPSTVVDVNGPRHGCEDLRLMTLCRHHIIANSSFSWWGAWLCRNENKLVYAPRAWFTSSAHQTQDVIPPQWHRL